MLLYGLNIPEQPLGNVDRHGRKHAALPAATISALNMVVLAWSPAAACLQRQECVWLRGAQEPASDG